MKIHHLRRDVVAILTWGVMLLGPTRPVDAQPVEPTRSAPVARSFNELKGRIQPDATIFVTDSAGHEVSGKFSALSDTSLDVFSHGKPRAFPLADVELVKQRQRDSLWNGFLIGAAAGTAPAIYWLFADPNECGGSVCPDDLVIGLSIGAAIGTAVDAAIQGKVTVYRSPSRSSTRTAFTVAPLVAQRRKGVQLTMSF